MPPRRASPAQSASGSVTAVQRTSFLAVQKEIIQWWRKHQRQDLPWRPFGGETPTEAPSHILPAYNPYEVWVSEVMSQQTQMGTVLKYFAVWMKKFPTIEALAHAREEDVRAVWSGMGFYRRAAYMHKGAQYLLKLHGDNAGSVRMPSTAKELLKVPGVGPYTAAAIAGVCYGELVASVDGNVVRVLSRLRGEEGFDPKKPQNIKLATRWGQELMEAGGTGCKDPCALNQGLIELGARVCRPAGPPLCEQCPLRPHCGAHTALATGSIPAIEGFVPLRGSVVKKRKEQVVCVVHEFSTRSDDMSNPVQQRRFVVVKRPTEGLLGGMLEFPSLTLSSGEEEPDEKDEGTPLPAMKRKARDGAVDNKEIGTVNSVATALRVLACGACTGSKKKNSDIVVDNPITVTEAVAPQLTRVGTVTHIFSHIDMAVSVHHVVWPCKADEEEFLGSSYDGARTAVEDAVCERLAESLEGIHQEAAPLASHAKMISPPVLRSNEDVRHRISIMSEDAFKGSAASRLMLKVAHALPKVAPYKRAREG